MEADIPSKVAAIQNACAIKNMRQTGKLELA
jgi:hypothetical protein